MIQPFLPSIVTAGEWSLFFFAGEYSHAVLKIPKTGDFRVQEEYGSSVQAAHPSESQQQLALQAVQAVGQRLLYARVDLVELPSGDPAVIELELIEPSLYFPYDPASPARFATATDQMLNNVLDNA